MCVFLLHIVIPSFRFKTFENFSLLKLNKTVRSRTKAIGDLVASPLESRGP